MKKILSIILTILMITTLVPMAFATEGDGVKTTLDISTGTIHISDSLVKYGDTYLEADPDGYIITGTSKGHDTALEITNNSDEAMTLELVFDNMKIEAGMWCSAFRINDYSPVVLNITCIGENYIQSYNHPAITTKYTAGAMTDIELNITCQENASMEFKRFYNPEYEGVICADGAVNITVVCDGVTLYQNDHTHTGGTQLCKGYLCEGCGLWYGEATGVHTGGVQTCKGYMCDYCYTWYGEGNGNHSGYLQTCMGYMCDICNDWYGEADVDGHSINEFEICDYCNTFFGDEIKLGDTHLVDSDKCFKFVPTVSGTFILRSESDTDPYVGLYNGSFEVLEYADDYSSYVEEERFDFYLEYNYTAGKTYYFVLKDYKAEYNNNIILECKEHNYSAATCTEPATCIACAATDGEALGHNIVVDEAVAPECDKTGLTEGEHCTRCDDATVAQEVIPVVAHTDTDKDGICDDCQAEVDTLCEQCGREVHEGFYNEIICLVMMFFKLIATMF